MKRKKKQINEIPYRTRISKNGGIFLKVIDDWHPNFEDNTVYCGIWARRLYICGADDMSLEFVGTEDKIKDLLMELLIEQPISHTLLVEKGFQYIWEGDDEWEWTH